MTTHLSLARRGGAALIALTITAVPLVLGGTANAAVQPVVPLGTAANYTVLAASTVTNTPLSPTVLDCCLGLSPGTSITGFPLGLVNYPGTIDIGGPAGQAQLDLSAAYVNAAGRSVDAIVNADLGNLSLGAGVYSAPGKIDLGLTGTLTLDGANDPTSVFVFQTNAALTTASTSRVSLINGAQECNVFWQVGSSATLGTGSDFAGNILAQASVTVTNGVTVHGRALARTAAVTLDNDRFIAPTCAQTLPPAPSSPGGSAPVTTVPTTTSTTTPGTTRPGTTTPGTTTPGTTTTTTAVGGPATTAPPGGPGGTTPGTGGPGAATPAGGTGTAFELPKTPIAYSSPGVPGVVGPPRTGGAPMRRQGSDGSPWMALLAVGMLGAGAAGVASRRAHVRTAPPAGR